MRWDNGRKVGGTTYSDFLVQRTELGSGDCVCTPDVKLIRLVRREMKMEGGRWKEEKEKERECCVMKY